ncbi:teichoic acid transport system permease protein [Paenibacillus sophorae]|uniref:Transport permease protein n=1 Tax=Paenibacillus sophorae TaxID=1333845 RepID=A0A1H8I1C3_9BACL|nr:ABC transporter permease [Paenibacillus sophorae]QWU15814.1 ABC transporter permease [Paenibacillus sophorae]SEN61935.1 teichoic acid transport system permease protein [Paenibacillus sophorae]
MKAAKHLLLFMCALIVLGVSYYYINLYWKENTDVSLHIKVKSEQKIDYQLFYADDPDAWSEEKSIHISYTNPGDWKELVFNLPEYSFIRIDFGNENNIVTARDLYITANSKVKLDVNEINAKLNQLKIEKKESEEYLLKAGGKDPFIYFDASRYITEAKHGGSWSLKIISLFLSLLAAAAFYFIGRYVKESIRFVRDFSANKELVLNLAKNDFKTKFASSYLGVLWGFINPLLTIGTYWFVFQVGLRSGDVGNVPFIIWFIAGIIPWFFFSDALSTATNAYLEYSYLVKKVVFKVELLPLVKIFSAFFVQLFFIIFIFVIYAFYGRFPTIYSFQLIYYVVCLLVLAVSVSFLTSSIVLFFKDLNQIIAVILQIGFWFTPIGWTVSMLSDFWSRVFKLNPMFYIVQGYRDTFIDHILFINRPYQTVYFWLFCLVLFTFSIKVFKKLKPHFSDVL